MPRFGYKQQKKVLKLLTMAETEDKQKVDILTKRQVLKLAHKDGHIFWLKRISFQPNTTDRIFKKRGYEKVPQSNKNQENPIYSVSSHFFKQIVSQGSS